MKVTNYLMNSLDLQYDCWTNFLVKILGKTNEVVAF